MADQPKVYRYTGKRPGLKDAYKDVDLVLDPQGRKDQDRFLFIKPDGRFTTWIGMNEVKKK